MSLQTITSFLTAALLGYLAVSTAACALYLVAAAALRHRRLRRLDSGTGTVVDLWELLRDKVDRTGTPYRDQRHLLADPLVGDDFTLLLDWARAGHPLTDLHRYLSLGLGPAAIRSHLTGAAPLDLRHLTDSRR